MNAKKSIQCQKELPSNEDSSFLPASSHDKKPSHEGSYIPSPRLSLVFYAGTPRFFFDRAAALSLDFDGFEPTVDGGVLFLYGGMEARQSAAQKEKALPSVCPTVQPKNNAVRLASIENREFFARMMSSSGCGLPDKRSRMRSSVIIFMIFLMK